MILPPSASPTRTRFAAADPFCVNAEVAEGWENWVIRGVAPLKRFQVIFKSEAPSLSPATFRTGDAAVERGLVSFPAPSKVRVPVTGVTAAFTSAAGKLRE